MKVSWLTVSLSLSLAVAPVMAGDESGVKTQLTGFQQIPPILTAGDGAFEVTVDANGTSIEYTLSYSNLQGAATVAHMHFGRSQSKDGVLAVLCGGGNKPPCSSSGTVTGRTRGQVHDRAQCCTSGIRGKVVLGPTCPVIPTPGAEHCQDQAYQAEMVVRSRVGFQGRGDGGVSKEVARFTSNSKGEFRIPLPAGTYSLESASTNVGGFPLAKPQVVKVEPGKFTTITFVFDTGLR